MSEEPTSGGIRAISEDPKGAIVSGIDIERANLVTWIWAGALAALAGVFFGAYTHLAPGITNRIWTIEDIVKLVDFKPTKRFL